MAAGYGAAWLSGWPPARLWRAALWSLPMTGVWLLATALDYSSWRDVMLAPGSDWRLCWHLTATGNPVAAFAVLAPVAVPAGDFIRFSSEPKVRLAQVKRVTAYESFDQLLDTEEPARIDSEASHQQQLINLRQIYGPEKEALGVLAIEVELT